MTRRASLFLILVLGGLVLLVSVPTWVTGQAASALGSATELAVTGTDAAPGVGAAGLAILAAGVATGLVGRGGRWVVVIVVGLSAAVVFGSSLAVVSAPEVSAKSAAGRLTGVSELIGSATLTVWPWAAMALSVLGIALVVRLAGRSTSWRVTSKRHERAQAHPVVPDGGGRADPLTHEVPDEPADMWDALTRGEDFSDVDAPVVDAPDAPRAPDTPDEPRDAP